MVESRSLVAPARPANAELPAAPLVPAVDIRVVLFAVVDGRLVVALRRDQNGGACIPRGFPGPDEGLDGEARRIVREGAGGGDGQPYLEQLYTLSIDGSPGWTIIVSYLGLAIGGDGADPGGGWWVPVDDVPPLAEADRMVLDYALVRLRAKIGYTTIAFHLLPPTFTLRELQDAYEAILGRPLDKRNFRRRVAAAGFLEATSLKRRDGSHRPAVVYRFRADHDPATYLTPPWSRTGEHDDGDPAPAETA
jgi:8-oxo-dGTP diphosphatase